MNYGHTYFYPRDLTESLRPQNFRWISLMVVAVCLLALSFTSIVISSAESLSLPISVSINFTMGWILIFAGTVQFIQAIVIRKWYGVLLMGCLGLVEIVYGVSFLLYPISGVDTALRLLIGFLACGGTIKLVLSARLYPHDGWVRIACNGYVSLILAFLLLLFNTNIATWVLGTLLGFDLTFYASWLMLVYSYHHTKNRSCVSNRKIVGNNFQCGNNVIYYNFKRD